MSFGAADERAHPPGSARGWFETWHLDVATGDGVGVAVRLACAPALGVAWWWTHVLLPDAPGPIVVRDHDVALPRRGLEVRADGLWGELSCEAPFEHWTYGLEAFGVRLDDPADALRGEIGERMPVGLDLEWEVDPDADGAHEHDLDDGAGYEQLGSVHGEVLIGRSRLELDAVGLRAHTWGAPRFDRPVGSTWLRSGDLAASFTTVGGRSVGFVRAGGAQPEPVSAVRSETHRRADGLPVAARHVLDDRWELDVEVLGLAPVPLAGAEGKRAVLARGVCRYEIAAADDPSSERAVGIGWSSWLDPE